MNNHTQNSEPLSTHDPVDSVCAIIVTYSPDAALLQKLLNSITTQADGVVIVDNTSQPRSIDPDSMITAMNFPFHHAIAFEENRGIAAAQNAGIAWARAQGFKYALLFDQDSVAAPGMVIQMVDIADDLIAQGNKLAAIGPRYVDPRSGRSSYALRIGTFSTHQAVCESGVPEAVIQSDVLISSGTLLILNSLEEIGPLDESLFIDHVDHDWCLRARHRGYTLYMACGAVLEHHLGAGRVRYWLGRWRSLPAHSATRNYFMLRNILLLTRRPYVPFAWLAGELASLIPALLVSLVLLPERVNRLGLILRAIYDGLRNRGGPLKARISSS